MKSIFEDCHKGHGWFIILFYFSRFLCKLKVFLSVFPIWINTSAVFYWLAHLDRSHLIMSDISFYVINLSYPNKAVV